MAKSNRNRPRDDELVRRGHGGRRARRHPERRGRPHHAVRRRHVEERRAARRHRSPSARRSRTRTTRSTRQAPHGPQVRATPRSSATSSCCPTRSSRRPNGDAHVAAGRPRLLAAGSLGDDPAEAEGRRGGLPRRDRHRGRDHRPGLLQRQPAPGDQGRRHRSPASKCCASSTSRRRRRWPTASTRRARKSSPSTTSAAAPSTSRSSSSARAPSRCKSTNGDTHLGGDDFDQRVIDWLVDEFKKDQGIDLQQDRMALQRLKEAAEKAKIELSTVQQTEINLPFITADAAGPKHLNLTLTRAKLEQLVGDLVERSLGALQAGAAGRRRHGRPDRRGRAGRRPDAHAARQREGAAVLRQGAAQGREPGRGRRHRRRDPGRRAQGRSPRRPAARRDAADPRHRDAGRRGDAAHPAQHDDPDEQEPGVLDRGRQPAVGRDPRPPGRARDGAATTSRSGASSSTASCRRRAACRRSR